MSTGNSAGSPPSNRQDGSPREEKKSPELPPRERLAIIYVHGMGDQTRLCDPTALLNNLESYWQESCLPEHLLHSTVQSHPSNPSEPHYSVNVQLPNGSQLDVHEVYWAPKAPNVAATTVLSWMRKQLLIPFLRRHSPWGELSRLKLGVLGQGVTTGHIPIDCGERLREKYTGFIKTKPCGNFSEFYKYIEFSATKPLRLKLNFWQNDILDKRKYSLWKLNPSIQRYKFWGSILKGNEALKHEHGKLNNKKIYSAYISSPQTAADRWQRLTKSNDLTAIWVVMSMILATLVFALFVTEAVVGLAQFFQQEPLSKWAARYGLSYGNLVDVWYIYPLIAMSVVMTLSWVFGIRPFFSKYMGDVVQWATYQETDEGFKVRKAILDTSSDVFRYVLRIPGADSQKNSGLSYHRVIVMAHSLGSVIAHDTLLTLKRDHPANLEKISDFITYGSPIDKFAYFFEALQGQSPRYVKTIHQLRGELFKGRTKPLIWQNFYEEGDPIGGTIHTTGPSWAAPDIPLTSEIRNIYTANANVALVAPNHTGYIQNELVLFRVWNALMPGILPDTPPKVNEVISPTDRQEHTDVDVMAHTRWMRQMYAVILLIPWVLLASYIAHGAHLIQLQVHQIALGAASDALRWIIGGGAVVSVVLLAISFWTPVHLLKPLAIALTALTLTGIYAALTTPGKTFWTDVPTKTAKANTDAPVAKEQKCESTFSGTEQNFNLDSTCKTPKPPQYTPALAAWGQEQKEGIPFAWIPWSSALVGLIAPALLAAVLLRATKGKSMQHATKLEVQTHEHPNTRLPRIIGILIAFIAVSSAAFPDGQAILPWWWWRTTLLYATFSLILVGLVQFVWPKRKLGHLLNP